MKKHYHRGHREKHLAINGENCNGILSGIFISTIFELNLLLFSVLSVTSVAEFIINRHCQLLLHCQYFRHPWRSIIRSKDKKEICYLDAEVKTR